MKKFRFPPQKLLNCRRSRLREALAVLRASEDLVRIGAYAAGTNPQLDAALRLESELKQFLRQRPDERDTFEQAEARMAALAGAKWDERRTHWKALASPARAWGGTLG